MEERIEDIVDNTLDNGVNETEYHRNRVVSVGPNPFLRAIGTVTNGNNELSDEKLMEAGQQMVDKYAELRAMAEAREGAKDVTVWDLMDLDVLADENLITEADIEMIQMAAHLRKIVMGMHSLGVEFSNDDFAEISLITTKLTEVPKKVCIKLYEDFKTLVNDPTVDTDLDDILINATADLISERASFETYAQDVLMLDLNEINAEEMSTLMTTYFDGYIEWKRDEAGRILSEVIKNPLSTVMILPKGFEEIKEVMMDVLPIEATDWVSKLQPTSIFNGEVWEYMTKTFGRLGDAQLKRVSAKLDEFISANGIMSQLGPNGQQVPILYTVNIAEILLHTLILASAELFEDKPDDELTDDTKYIADTFRYVLYSDPVLNQRIDDTTANRILSTISSMLPLATARSSSVRSVNREYNVATSTITTFITEDIQKANVDQLSEAEKEAIKDKIIGNES